MTGDDLCWWGCRAMSSFSKWMKANQFDFLTVRSLYDGVYRFDKSSYIVEMDPIYSEIARFKVRDDGTVKLKDLFYAVSAEAKEYQQMKAIFKKNMAARDSKERRTPSGVVMEVIRHFIALELGYEDVPFPEVEDAWQGGTIMSDGEPMESEDLKAYANYVLERQADNLDIYLSADQTLCQDYIRSRSPEASLDNIAQHGFYGLFMKTTWVDIAASFVDAAL